MRLHGFAARNRRTGQHRAATVSTGPIQQYIVFVLWEKAGPDQGTVLGGERIHPAVQAVGERQLSVAEKLCGCTPVKPTAVPVADGGAKYRSAEGASSNHGAEHHIDR